MPDVVTLVKARSMLLVLQATCEQTLRACEATGDVIDEQLVADLRSTIEHAVQGLEALNSEIAGETSP